ncbi:MAG: YggS family pyridoxal phosphate-dependent enzyme [Oscillospiraceae bacterium]|jgi:pyridoxal phosphate enzyme (YggS family)|nr:YggS family pyridoxal phosphate-dependent enzyme [Oscillospiraceae bacterium]
MSVASQYNEVAARVAETALRAGRGPGDVRLMAVTKTVDEGRIREAMAAGAGLLGENRVQELERKRPLLPPGEMHLIGHLQSNKAAKAVAVADMIQSVDTVRLARLLSEEAGKQGKRQDILLEVNIGRDEAKFGFLPEQLGGALDEIALLPHLCLRGLMTVPPLSEDREKTKNFFLQMREVFIDICGKKMDNIRGSRFDVLSMGMSGDYELAIEAGSTLVRVGSAIFGMREYR